MVLHQEVELVLLEEVLQMVMVLVLILVKVLVLLELKNYSNKQSFLYVSVIIKKVVCLTW